MLQSMCIALASGEGWSIKLNGTVNTDTEKYFAKLATEAGETFKFSGDDALYIKYPGTNKTATENLEIKNKLAEPTEAGESYTLKFYIIGSRTSEYQEAVLGSTVLVNFKNITKTKVNAADAPSGQNGWYEYSYTFTAATAENEFMFRFYGGTSGAIIDDVSLIKDGTEDNLITKGGFEEALEEEEEVETEYDQTPYTPVNIIASPSTTGVVLSWKNPEAKTLSKISVYDITDGKNELLADNIGTTASKIIYHQVDGFASGEDYQLKLVFTFSDKGDFAYYIKGAASTKTTENAGEWQIDRTRKDGVDYCPIDFSIDTTEKKSGEASLNIQANLDRTVQELKASIYLNARLASRMEVGKTYQVSFWIKGEEVSTAPQITMQWIEFDDHVRAFDELKGTYDWTEVKVKYTYTEKSSFYFVYDGYCKNMWLDDVEIYELDEEGNVSEGAENLVPAGGFEDIAKNEVAKISNLKAIPTPGGLDLNWNISDESCKYVEIYEKYYDKYLYRGTAIKDSKISLTNLVQGKEYTFSLVPVNNDNIKGIPQEVTATTILPEYEIGKVILKCEGEEVETLKGAGEYTVTFSVKNNVFEDGMNVEQFVAVFDENNVLWKIVSTKKTISKTGHRKPYTNITTSFTVPEDNYTAEYFVFDDRSTMNIIGEENPHKVFVTKK